MALIQGMENANKTRVRFGWRVNGGFLEGAAKTLWFGKTGDQVAFDSTNADWERLFQQTDLEIATAAIQATTKLRETTSCITCRDTTARNGSARCRMGV